MTAFQSSPEIRSALAFSPEIRIRLWLPANSLINLQSVLRVSGAVIEFTTLLLLDLGNSVAPQPVITK